MRGDNQLARLAARLGTRRAGVLLGVRVPILGGGVVVVVVAAVLVVAVVVVVAAAGGVSWLGVGVGAGAARWCHIAPWSHSKRSHSN